jgi:hypothetical protein
VPPRLAIPTDDLYARLEVPVDASFEAIEIAWRALLKRHHPDVAGGASLELAKRINIAHDWLSDPGLRDRYDRDRLVRSKWGGTGSRWDDRADDAASESAEPVRRPRRAADPAAALRRFLERVSALTRVELDRLSVADTTSIAFAASIHRFLTPAQASAIATLEREVRGRLGSAEWARAPVRDAVLAAGHELVLAAFLDEHLSEPYRGRARERLMRGWEASLDQPRYGPNTPAVERFVERARALTVDELETLVRIAGRLPVEDLPWPPGLDPDEDEGLRVSSVLAARDASGSVAFGALDRPSRQRAERALGRTAHAFVLRHAFTADTWAALLAPWRAATADPGTGRVEDQRPEPRVTRR